MRAGLARLVVVLCLLGIAGCTGGGKSNPAPSTVPSTVDRPAESAPFEADQLTGPWVSANGDPVPPVGQTLVFDIGPGPDHCGQQGALLLFVSVPFGTPATTTDDWRVFVRDPNHTLHGPPWPSGLDLDSQLPQTAQFTGFSTGDIGLWVDEDQQYAFVTDGQTVERWPRVDPIPWCA